MKALKPWLSFSDQLQQLRARGLEVEDPAAALDYLERVGYYRLSGYWYPLRTIDQASSAAQGRAVRLDSFVAGSRFEDVVRLYVFDKKLRLLALDALERIEMAVRVDIAHLLGQRDPGAHENPAFLHGNFAKKLITRGGGCRKDRASNLARKIPVLASACPKGAFCRAPFAAVWCPAHLGRDRSMGLRLAFQIVCRDEIRRPADNRQGIWRTGWAGILPMAAQSEFHP